MANSVGDFLRLLTEVSFLLIAGLTMIDFLRHRDRTRLDIALMFGALVAIILIGWAARMTDTQARWVSLISALMLLAQPYLLLRLVQHFRPVRRAIRWSAFGGMLVSWAMISTLSIPPPMPLTLLIVAYFVYAEGYAALAFVRGALATSGVTHWRLLLAAAGSGLLAAIIFLAGINAVLPLGTGITTLFSRLLGLLAAVSYYLGFSPPSWLRRAWQLSELHCFLHETAGHPATERATETLKHLCLRAMRTVGGLAATVALWNDAEKRLVLQSPEGSSSLLSGSLAADDGAMKRAWSQREPTVARTPTEMGTDSARLAAAIGAGALFAVPITTTERAWGLLLVFLPHAPLFATDDLALLTLFTEQSAITLDYAALLAEQRSLIERLRKWSHIFEHAEWGVVVGNTDGETLETMNPAFAKMHGYTVEELTGRSILDVFAPEARAELPDQIRLAHERGHYTFESKHIRKDGTIFPVLVDVTAVRDKDGTALYRVANVQDITERVRAEEALRNYAAQLKAANKELEAFSYSVSHDLRAPLRAIDGFSRILIEDYAPQLAPEPQRYLGLVRDNTRQMGDLIDDLLTFSRLSRQPVQKQIVGPAELVRQALEELQAERVGRQVEITIGDLPFCEADPALLRQVWLNLLANALKYTRRREVAVIEVGGREDDGELVYFVKDNGVGFEMQYAHKLFGVFQRLHRAEEYEGTGVGLATVQRITHRHGGRVWAEAEVDKGATFYFTLPVVSSQ